MKLSHRKLTIAMTFLTGFLLCAGVAFVRVPTLAQKPDASAKDSKTTTEPDSTYGKGGTKETTTTEDGTREVQKDKDGRPQRAVEKNGNNETEVTWQYDKQGRILRVVVKSNKKNVAKGRKYYKDGNDDEGTAEGAHSDDAEDSS